MRRNRPRLLVTGFGPFPGIPSNPSAELAKRVAASPRWKRLEVSAKAFIIPTTYAALCEDLAPALNRESPDAVLMIGVAGRSRCIRIERRALNRLSLLLPDAAGWRPTGVTLGNGPAARLLGQSPIRLRTVLERHRVACEISQNAGWYLCNVAYYQALAFPAPVVFLHIPKPPRKRRGPGVKHRLAWEQRLEAAFVDVALEFLALTLRDTRRPLQVAASVRAD